MRPNQRSFQMADLPPPTEEILLAHFIVSGDVERSRRFYTEVLGGWVVRSGEPTYVALSNSWIIINVGGGRPTTSGLSPWRPRAIPTGSAASSTSASGTSRRCTPNGEPAAPTS
jgi:hypothetical protein